jgi:hypothetical protein
MMLFNEEELKPVRKQDVEEIVKKVESLLKDLDPINGAEKCENFCLEFSLKCFRSTQIEKRVNGLIYIVETIETALTQQLVMKLNPFERDDPNYTRSISLDWLLKWVKSKKIVEDLFGPNTHDQLISKSETLLIVLGEKRLLTREDLDRIWTTARDSYLMRPTLRILTSLANEALCKEDCCYLWKKICELPVTDFTSELVNFIPVLYRRGDFSEFQEYYQLLWRLFGNQTSLRSEVAARARKHFVDIIRSQPLDMRYILKLFCLFVCLMCSSHCPCQLRVICLL